MNNVYLSYDIIASSFLFEFLQAYADSVIASGVHGALLFLERGNFTSEHLANIVHIPPKSALRKLLASQLAKLFSTEEITR